MRATTALVRVHDCGSEALTSGAIALRRAVSRLIPADLPRVWMEALEPRRLLAATAATVSLDTSFGIGGYAADAYGYNGNAAINAVAAGPGGTIYEIAAQGTFLYGADPEIGLARFNADGTLDPTFGRGGEVLLLGPSFVDFDSFGTGLLVQPDGKVLVTAQGMGDSVTVLRLNPDGTPDPGFGTGGRFDVPPTSARDQFPNDASPVVHLRPDGKIDVLYDVGGEGAVPGQPLLLRLNADGTPDETFAPGGTVSLDLSRTGLATDPAASVDFWAWGSQSLPDGGLIAYLEVDFALYKLAFDGHGAVTSAQRLVASLPGWDQVTLLPDGRVLVLDTAAGTIQRLNADGTSDPSFHSPDLSSLPPLSDAADDVRSYWVQPLADGKLLLGLLDVNNDGDTWVSGVARLNADGTPDLTFAGGEMALGLLPSAGLAGVALPDGSYVLPSETAPSNNCFSTFALAKVAPDGGTPDTYDPAVGTPVGQLVLQNPGDAATALLISDAPSLLSGDNGCGCDGSSDGGSDGGDSSSGPAGQADGGSDPSVPPSGSEDAGAADLLLAGLVPANAGAAQPFAVSDRGFFARPPGSSIFNPLGNRQVFDALMPPQ